MKKIQKPISLLLALMMVVSLFSIVPFTASAATTAITAFLDCTSGSAEGYFTYADHFYQIEWTNINTTYTHSVRLVKWYDDLAVHRNGQDAISTLRPSPSSGTYWHESDITSLTAGQSSSGYSNAMILAEGAGGTDYRQVCTVTCAAANAPAWSWSADCSACTATFVCAADPTLTATVNAAVSTEGDTAAATVTFNGATYTATTTIPDFYVNEAGDTYTIRNAAGWGVFCDMLADNDKGIFNGKTVKLDADISVTRMAGGSYHDFTGTFDGQGHTLTVAYGTFDEPVSNDDKTAPFRNAETGCVIKNLHTAGTIYTSKKYAGGFIGTQYGTVRLENCRSSVTINSLTAGDGTHGGFVGNNGNGSDLTIDGCVFDGKILSAGETATTSCSGFVGYKHNSGTITLTNCVYDPAALEAGETEVSANSATFVRNGSADNNCYYTRELGSVENQGKQAHSVTAGQDVSVALSGEATVYSVSGITAYADNSGLLYGDTIYAGNEDSVALALGYTGTPATGSTFTGYTASAGALENGVLTMPAEDVTIGAGFEQATYTITVAPTAHGNVLSIKDAAVYGEYVALIMMPGRGYYTKSVYINGNVLEKGAGGYSFYMPDEDVTVTAVFEKLPVGVTYLDENGTEHTVQAVPLDPSMTTLEEGWYVVNSNITYTEPVTFTGNVNLILCDNATLTATAGIQVNGSGRSLTIYAQSTGDDKGALLIEDIPTETAGIDAANGSVTINGGDITIDSMGSGISAESGDITINGGVINVNSNSTSTADSAINAGTVTINNGDITVYSSREGINALPGSVTINGGDINFPETKYGIYTGTLTINDAGITVNATTDAFYSVNDITIRNSNITAKANNNAINFRKALTIRDSVIDLSNYTNSKCTYGIGSTYDTSSVTIENSSLNAMPCQHGIRIKGDITIIGGNVSVLGVNNGIRSDSGSISLSWTTATDSIHTNKYTTADDTVTLQKPFNNGTTVLPEGYVDDFTTINSKTLTPHMYLILPSATARTERLKRRQRRSRATPLSCPLSPTRAMRSRALPSTANRLHWWTVCIRLKCPVKM